MFHRATAALCVAFGVAVAPQALQTHAPLFYTAAAAKQLGTAYTPDQIETAYDITPLYQQGINGTGQTIALVEFGNFDPADIQQFDQSNNLPDPTIHEYYPAGHNFNLQNDGETTMDIEWAHAIAPGATIQVYYLNNNQSDRAGWQSLATAVKTASTNGATVISMSFGACRVSSGYKTAQTALAAVARQGIGVFVSSGDAGSYPGPKRICGTKPGVAYPASDPSVISVGGTSLQLNSDNTIASETTWNLTGGGKGNPLARPSWQITPALHAGKYRYVPDVAFLADPRTGGAVYYKGTWRQAGGTSLGAPSWAAIWSLVRQKVGTTSNPPALLYRIGNSSAYTTAFHDIVSGSNGRYHAGIGWDAVTGWGTPDTLNLISAVQSQRTTTSTSG